MFLKRLRCGAGIAVDLAALTFLSWLRLLSWHRGENASLPVPEWWWRWGTASDFVLFGPDAGNWATNARALATGGELDVNRQPVYGWLTAGMSNFTGDFVFSGHLVNHLVGLGLVFATWWLGRLAGGRAVGLLAGLLVATSPLLIAHQQLYSADPTFHLTVVLLAACTVWAIRGPAIAVLLAGAMGGICMGTHSLGLLFPILCAIGLLFHPGRWWRRLGGPVVFLGAAGGVWAALLLPYPDRILEFIVWGYTEGVLAAAPNPDLVHQGGGVPIGDPTRIDISDMNYLVLRIQAALEFMRLHYDGAISATLDGALHPLRELGIPERLCLVGCGAGVVGWVVTRDRRGGRTDLGMGVLLVLMLLPAVLMHAVDAPARYLNYALPFVFLLFARGVAAVGALLDGAISRKWRPWPSELCALLVVAGLTSWMFPQFRTQRAGPRNWAEGWHEREVGEFIRDTFGPGGAMVGRAQGIAFYAERDLCSHSSHTFAIDLQSGREILASKCRGDGPIPYVIEIRAQGHTDRWSLEFDEWVAENLEPLRHLETPQRTSTVYSLPRTALSQ